MRELLPTLDEIPSVRRFQQASWLKLFRIPFKTSAKYIWTFITSKNPKAAGHNNADGRPTSKETLIKES